jgi:Glyoxalase-like domain
MTAGSNAIDHIVFGCSDLERGMDEIEQLLGIRPVPGGRHIQFGTHNALLSLGPATYLEVIGVTYERANIK